MKHRECRNLHVQNEGRKFASSILLPSPSSPPSPTTMPTSVGIVLLHIYTCFVPLRTVAAFKTVRENIQVGERMEWPARPLGIPGPFSSQPRGDTAGWATTPKKHHNGPCVGNLSRTGMIFSIIQGTKNKRQVETVYFLIVSLLLG